MAKQIKDIPTFYATEEQMKDINTLVFHIKRANLENAGAVKVVPRCKYDPVENLEDLEVKLVEEISPETKHLPNFMNQT